MLPRLPALYLAWHYAALVAIVALAATLNFFQLTRAGYPNAYYAATVRSMLTNWHAFFFAAYDPVGFVTVDKPPLGFWIQAASAKLLGFSPFSLLLPEALAGVLSVLVLHHLVRRIYGPVAGLIAALALALTPINVVTNRNNTIDSLLILALLLAAWAVSKAAEGGRLRWLLLGAALVGLGFNIRAVVDEVVAVVQCKHERLLAGFAATDRGRRCRWRIEVRRRSPLWGASGDGAPLCGAAGDHR